MYPADVSAILQNSLTPITTWVLDKKINVKYFFLNSSTWSWELKPIITNEGNAVIYGVKLAIIMSFPKNSMFQYIFSWYFFLFLKIGSYFQLN